MPTQTRSRKPSRGTTSDQNTNASSPLFSVGIVAHTRRAPAAENLANVIGADHSVISYDDDTIRLGCEANHRRVWEWHTKHGGAQWAITLEEDAIPVDDFTTQATQALAVAPTPIVSFYLGKERPPQYQDPIRDAITAADLADACWISPTEQVLLHGVGYAIHTDLLPSLLAYTSTIPVEQHISAWATHNGHHTAYTWPSLVNHDDTMPSAILRHHDKMGRIPGREAWRVGTRTAWTAGSVTMRPPGR